jgi:hypothetical protein
VLSKPSYNWHEDDFWQTVEEPPDNSVEKVLSCGFPGFGPKTVLSITQYLKDNQLPVTLFNALMILSTCDTKGKRVFKIPGVGDKTFKQVREILYGDKPFSTLNVSAFDGHGNFAQGAQTALDQFHAFFQEKLNKGVKPNQAYNEAMAIVRSGISELIPF